jgi:ribosome-associated translation inhibitor RaiA
MHIYVLGDETISSQARTYAEYRVFAALTQLAGAEQVRDARVVLRRANRTRAGEGVTCLVTVTLAGSSPLRVQTTGDHPYAAINRAVERLRSPNTSELVDQGPSRVGDSTT